MSFRVQRCTVSLAGAFNSSSSAIKKQTNLMWLFLQVQKLRFLTEELNVPIPKIGSVEEFQGQERKVIILSAVRSSSTLLKTDIRHAIGFIASPKRLNVALTRARALLIILGNPHVLAQDPCWREVLEYCVKHGGYIGCDLPTDYNSLTLDDSEWEKRENFEWRVSYCALFTIRVHLHHYYCKGRWPFLLYFMHSLFHIHGDLNAR